MRSQAQLCPPSAAATLSALLPQEDAGRSWQLQAGVPLSHCDCVVRPVSDQRQRNGDCFYLSPRKGVGVRVAASQWRQMDRQEKGGLPGRQGWGSRVATIFPKRNPDAYVKNPQTTGVLGSGEKSETAHPGHGGWGTA